MFTTIEALRASHAMQDRVTKVETFLKNNAGGKWEPKALFPAEIVLLSNTHDDYEWVRGYKKDLAQVLPGLTKAVTDSVIEKANPKGEADTKADAQKIIDNYNIELKILNPAHVSFYATPVVPSGTAFSAPAGTTFSAPALDTSISTGNGQAVLGSDDKDEVEKEAPQKIGGALAAIRTKADLVAALEQLANHPLATVTKLSKDSSKGTTTVLTILI